MCVCGWGRDASLYLTCLLLPYVSQTFPFHWPFSVFLSPPLLPNLLASPMEMTLTGLYQSLLYLAVLAVSEADTNLFCQVYCCFAERRGAFWSQPLLDTPGDGWEDYNMK